jgi:hypothetical protein
MPELFQVIDDEAEYVLVIEEQKRKRPNSPGTSKRKHFERANQKRRRKDFEWYAPSEKSTQVVIQKRGDSKRFTRTAPDTEPHVEPPRPEGWKPLVLTAQLVQLSEDAERKLADDRMKEWSKDQEEYSERQFREIEEKKADLKSQAEAEKRRVEIERQAQVKKELERKAALKSQAEEAEKRRVEIEMQPALKAQAEIERSNQEAREKAQAEQRKREQEAKARREATKAAQEARERRRIILEEVQKNIPAKIAKYQEQLTQETSAEITRIKKEIEDLKAQGIRGRALILRGLERDLEEAKERFIKWKGLTRRCIQFEEEKLNKYQAILRESGDLV